MDVFRSFWNRRGAAPGGAATSSGRPAGCREENSSVLLQSLKASSEQKKGETPLQNVAAADYVTPQKYLDDPDKIPTYYVFQSNMVTDEDLLPGMLRNLEVDKRLTLPTRTHIRFLITATDVIHSWAVPALGIKADAIPGRLQRINTFIQREGVFYGQCSELCGALHGFMPIVIEAVSPETYAAHAKKWYKD
ncbi:UNVERIFIED_CONTAM: cytochrome C oxidase subunit IIb, putative [Hammondia hammondi]|eukprot:XP_008886576.1 cytochrome C oxidase subunit IIb, putative [Hammondia hammondi]